MIKMNKLTSAVILGLYGVTAIAQTDNMDIAAEEAGLEVINVTANKRVQNLQDVPVAVNAFSSFKIQEAGINDAHDLANMTPSLNLTNSRNPFQNRLAIRGIGTSQNDPALEPSVGMFVDGVFIGRTGLGMSDLTDIERIEVLQGPQGTLYGKNTNAGAISVITKRPDLDEFEGYSELSVGNYGMNKVTVSATGPLSETVAYRISGNTHQRDGFYDNVGSGADLSDADDWNVQGKLLWEASDELSILLSASHVDRDTKGGGFDVILGNLVQAELAAQGLPQVENDPFDYKIATDTDGVFEMEADNLSLHIDYDLDWGTFTSITAWNDYEYLTRSDPDGSQLDIIRSNSEQFLGDSLSQEFRLDSTIGDNINYQVGLFYYEQTSQRGADDGAIGTVLGDDFVTIAGPSYLGANALIGPRQIPLISFAAQPGDYISGKNVWDSETLAAFGQVTWNATEDLHVTAGLRWTDEEKEADLLTVTHSTATGVPPPLQAALPAPLLNFLSVPFIDRLTTAIDATFDRRSINTDWLINAAYDLDDNSMVYTSVSTGTKSGNFNGVSGPADTREFDDEDTKSYELGFKSKLLDSRLRLNAAAFFSEIKNWQFQFSLPDGGTTVSNEGAVEVSGLDISLQALPIANLTLEAGLLYMDKYEVTDGPNTGKELAFTADLSGNLAATLVFPLDDGTIYIRGDYVFMGDHYTSFADSRQKDTDYDDRNVFNAKIGWRNEDWNVSIWGKNLNDDEYASVSNPTQRFSGNKAYVLAAPRTFGVDVRYNF
jgi:iron complex outermembrane receptor protein